MVTPTYGTATFAGASGRTYSVDFYIADVVGQAVRFDSGSGAGTGSLAYWKAPESVILKDLSIVANPTVMTALLLTADGAQIPGVRARIANFLNTLAFRPNISIGFKAGSSIGMIEQ
jgi:hypothetical protein